jgi:hypothetical protein
VTRSQIQSGAWFLFVACAIAFAPNISPLERFSDYLRQHPQPYLGIATGMTVLGIGLFITVGFVTACRDGRRMTDAEAKKYAGASPRVPSYSVYRGYFRGKAVGQQVENSNNFRDIKSAFRSGAWRHDRAWRRFLLMAAGALFWLYGGFGIALLLGPPAVKVIVGAALLYVSVRLSWSIWRA